MINRSFVPHTRRVARNIPLYFVYMAIQGVGFGLFAAMWVIYLQHQRGLSLSQAALIDVTFFVAAALAEVPTGVVADRFGRKTSLVIGTALMGASTWGWIVAPTLPLVVVAYICLGIGFTFLSGAQDALFYESVQRAGRSAEYTRLVGRVGATMMAALALGSASSGLLATWDVTLPFVCAGLSYGLIFVVVLCFTEPNADATVDEQVNPAFGHIFRQSAGVLRARPAVRYPMLYLAVVPIAALILETLFVQPQAVQLGVPLAGIGVIVMALHMVNVVGSACSERIGASVGERRTLLAAPALLVGGLVLLALLQHVLALAFIALISLVTAVVRPIMLSRMQDAVADNVRATTLSVQSLLFTVVAAVSQPTLGLIADRSGLPAAYVVLAAGLGLISLIMYRLGRNHFPRLQLPLPKGNEAG